MTTQTLRGAAKDSQRFNEGPANKRKKWIEKQFPKYCSQCCSLQINQRGHVCLHPLQTQSENSGGWSLLPTLGAYFKPSILFLFVEFGSHNIGHGFRKRSLRLNVTPDVLRSWLLEWPMARCQSAA